MRLLFTILIGVVFLFPDISAQKCGTPDADLSDPFQVWFNQAAKNTSTEKTQVVRIIPVAVHVIYDNSLDAQNISLNQIQSQIDILNDDYRGISGGEDTQVEFCLAGVKRIQSTLLM